MALKSAKLTVKSRSVLQVHRFRQRSRMRRLLSERSVFPSEKIALGCVSIARKKSFAFYQSLARCCWCTRSPSLLQRLIEARTGAVAFRKPRVCGPTATVGKSNFGHNSRVLGLGGKWTAPGYRAVRRHGPISLPLERGQFVADVVRRSHL